MLTKIFIKRQFKEGKTREIVALLKDLRSKAMIQQGYVSGETLMEPGNPQNLLVIGTWQSMENWHAWKANRERKIIEDMLELYQKGPTKYEEYVLGAPFREYFS